MKTSDSGRSQSDVERVANELLHENGGKIERVLGNQVALRLGMAKANQAVYEKFKIWIEERRAEGIEFADKAPAGLQEAIEVRLEQALQDICRISLGMTGQAVAEAQTACERDRAALRDSLERSEASKHELLLQLADNEAKLAASEEQRVAVQNKISQIKAELAGSKAREAELRSITTELMARIGAPDSEPDAPERLHRETVQPSEAQEVKIDMSRYDYKDDA